MGDMTGMTGRIGVVGSGRSFYVLSLFVLNIGFARAMGAAEFGSFQQVFMFGAFFTVLMLGIPETMYFFLPRLTHEERPGFLGQTLLFLAASGTVLFLIFLFFAPILARIQGNPGIVRSLRLFGAYGGFMVAAAFADPVFIVFKRVRFLFGLSVLHGLFFIAITVWRYYFTPGSEALFAAMAVFSGIKCALAVFLAWSMRSMTGGIDLFGGKKMFLLQLSFSIPVALSNTVDIISTWLDKFMVSFYLGKDALGIFYVGAMEIPFVSVLLTSIYGVVSPVLSSHHHRGDMTGFADLVKKTIHFAAKFIWPLWIYLVVFADRVIPALFGQGYDASIQPFRIYLMLMPLRIALYGAMVIALGKPRIVLWSAAGALLLNVILNVILIMKVGIIGPAIATVVSSYAHVGILLFVVMAQTRADIAGLVPFRGLFEIAVTAGIAVLVSYAATVFGMTGGDLETVAVTFSIFSGLYIFLGKRAGFIRFIRPGDILKGSYGGRES